MGRPHKDKTGKHETIATRSRFYKILQVLCNLHQAQCLPSLYGYKDLATYLVSLVHVQDLVDSNNRQPIAR